MKSKVIIVILMLVSLQSFANILKVSDISKVGQYHNKGVVVTAKQAKSLIEKTPDIIVFDVRKPLMFATGHLPKAINIWRDDFNAVEGDYDFEGMRASKEKIEELLNSYGVRTHTKILIYDTNGNYDATRLWWMLSLYGHRDMAIIDGGLQAWKSSKLPVKYGMAKARYISNYIFVRREKYDNTASIEDVKSMVSRGRGTLIDTRTDDEYTKGRIPNSELTPWDSAIYLDTKGWTYSKDEENRVKKFKTIKELEEVYAKYKGKNIITYSNSGIGSAHTMFVLTQLLGYKNVKTYDGSWNEWSHENLKTDKN